MRQLFWIFADFSPLLAIVFPYALIIAIKAENGSRRESAASLIAALSCLGMFYTLLSFSAS